MQDYKNTEEFFLQFKTSCNNYVDAGGTLKKEKKIKYMIKYLPPHLSQVELFIDIVPAEKQNIEFVMEKIKEANMLKNDTQNKPSISTFNSSTKNTKQGVCFICKISGHHKKDCWYNKDNKNQQNKTKYKNKNNNGNRKDGSKGGSTSGGQGQQRDHRRQQENSSHHQGQQNNDISTWTLQVRAKQVFHSEVKSDSEVEWLLDSGCTNHLINSANFFEKSCEFRVPIDVNLTDGERMKSTRIGNVITYFKEGHNVNKVCIENVYYVEGLRQNILSFSKITNTCKIIASMDEAEIYE